MASHSVKVLVKARDEASRKFGVIGGAATIMKNAFKSVSSVARKTMAVAFKAAKYAVMGLAAAFAYCTYAAIKQEQSEFELAAALRVTGQYSAETMEALKQQADVVQAISVYGDEYVMTLQRMALNQGIAADSATDAAKAAIALFKAYGGGRGKPEIFLRYYLDALRGTAKSLDTYIGELRLAKTEEERQIILAKKVAEGWAIVEAEANTTGGALKQMKNVLGDVAEEIAWPFLPGITKSAKAVKDWALENKDEIASWADKTHSYLKLVKDLFLDFVDFMRDDWRSGMRFVFDSFLKLLRTTFEAAVMLAIAGGKGIYKGIKQGLLGGDEEGLARRIEQIQKRRERIYREYEEEWRRAGRTSPFAPPSEARRLKYPELKALAQKELLSEQTRSILGEGMEAVTDSFKKTFKAIWEEMPPDLRAKAQASYEAHLKRLEDLAKAEAEGGPQPGFPKKSIADSFAEAVGAITKSLRAREYRLLTFAPGQRFDYQKETAQNTKQMVKKTTTLIDKVDAMLDSLKSLRPDQQDRDEFLISHLRL